MRLAYWRPLSHGRRYLASKLPFADAAAPRRNIPAGLIRSARSGHASRPHWGRCACARSAVVSGPEPTFAAETDAAVRRARSSRVHQRAASLETRRVLPNLLIARFVAAGSRDDSSDKPRAIQAFATPDAKVGFALTHSWTAPVWGWIALKPCCALPLPPPRRSHVPSRWSRAHGFSRRGARLPPPRPARVRPRALPWAAPE